MEIRICCGNMASYASESYIKLEGKQPVLDTALYDENSIDIDYCPFCGKKIELLKLKEE